MEKKGSYCFGRTVDASYEETVSRARKALQEEGFGILSEIDVRAKLKEKLGIDFRPYIILGACNPRLAHQGLSAEINLGTLLPCNVVVYVDDGERTVVMAMDPATALGMVANPALEPIAAEVRERISRALERL
jgi:uncharacterized protein (DUF302 family)